MLKASIGSATALLALCGTAFAQPAGITAEMINTTLPLEGAPLAVPGPYQTMSEPTFGKPGLILFRPTNLDAFPARDKLPVLVWGNGGCGIDTTRYGGFLSTIVSHGFIAIGTVPLEGAAPPQGAAPQQGGAPQAGAPRRQATADDLRGAIDWAFAENGRAGSPLNGKIDTTQVAVMGQSCGGFLSIGLGADPRVDTIGVFNSGVTPPNPNAPANPNAQANASRPTMDSLKNLHGPVLLINGHERDFLMGASKATFDAINHVPAFYGARHGAGHTATVFHPGGGEYANVASNWLKWQFKKDAAASKMFVGDDCSLCTNSNWDTESKGFGK
ncbi:MAG TPA: alpha/beta hydrolase [Gammaproteobacteria bacterium]|nr:alpha/beta hydrolase [Gammaproteobacteria bacterium]